MSPPAPFPYPGDDPGALTVAADRLDLVRARIDRLQSAMLLSRGALWDAWITEARDLADADVGVLASGLPTVATSIDTARTALLAHQSTLTRIRADVDDLVAEYRQQEELRALAEQTFRSYAGRSDGAAEFGRQQAIQDGQDAVEMQENLVDDYGTLVTQANSSTQTCADALTTAWDPQHRSRGVCLANPGAELLGPAGITADSLNMLRIQDDVAEATRLTAELREFYSLDASDPQVQQALTRLAEIWDANSGSGVFAAAFYADLGASGTVDLFGRVALALQPNVDADESGPITPALLQELQRDLGTGLALATGDLRITSGGVLWDGAAGGLGVSWVQDLMAAGRSDITLPWGINPIEVKGYVPLLATVANGSGFSAGFLRAVGDDMLAVEQQRSGSSFAESIWFPSLDQPVKWNWATPGYDFPRGSDPFTSWTTAMINSPGESAAVLATDENLLDYLLNGRSWAMRDSGDEYTWIYGAHGDREVLEGLSYFGDALPQIIGPGSAGVHHRDAFESVVSLLGSADHNPRIGSGAFTESDWIPPELRPGLGSLLIVNADSIHNTLATASADDETMLAPYRRVLMETAKASAPDAAGFAFVDRMLAAEDDVLTDLNAAGDLGGSDWNARAWLAALVTHGENVANTDIQQAADAAHNGRIDQIAGGVGLIVDTAATLTGPFEAPLQHFGGGLIDLVAGDFRQDTSAQAIATNFDNTTEQGAQVSHATTEAVYAFSFDALPDPPPAIVLTANGQPLDYYDLSDEARRWVEANWPDDLDDPPEDVGSDAEIAFTAASGWVQAADANR